MQEPLLVYALLYAKLPPSSAAAKEGALSPHRHKKRESELRYFLSAIHPDAPLDSGTMCEVHLEAR